MEGCDGFSFGRTELQVPLGAVPPKSRVPGGQVWKGAVLWEPAPSWKAWVWTRPSKGQVRYIT